MAKLVIGTSKDKTVPAIVRDVAPAYYIEKGVTGTTLDNNGSKIIDLTNVTNIGSYALANAYRSNTALSSNTTVDFSSLTMVNGNSACIDMFNDCNKIGAVNLSGLQTISGYQAFARAFQNSSVSSINLSSLASITSNYGCENMFSNCQNITSVDLSSLSQVTGQYCCQYMFKDCKYITSVDLSSLNLSGNNANSSACKEMFRGCIRLTSVDLSSLTDIDKAYGCSNMFDTCTALTSIDLSSLKSITQYQPAYQMFIYCSALTSVDLSGLETLTGSQALSRMFTACTSLQTLSFPALKTTSFGSLTNQFNNMLIGVTGCTVHFPSNLQAVIGSWADVTAGFGGTNTTVLFDLPATE